MIINKRLLIKNLLAYTNENSFYDKKRLLQLDTREGKSKFIKHICALSNSNPFNNSYIVVGVEDQDNEIVGTSFFDDSRIQNLVNAYLQDPPNILYENVLFPQLDKDQVIGLVTISPKQKISCFKKGIGLIPKDTIYVRVGSNSLPTETVNSDNDINSDIVQAIENSSRNSIQHTLDSVMGFIQVRHADIQSEYKVFKDLFVLCWAGIAKKSKEKTYYSRVDIELVNEQVKLFYSVQDEVSIFYDEDVFEITEYISVEMNGKIDFFPFERVSIVFNENGSYFLKNELIFQKPVYDQIVLKTLYTKSLFLLEMLNAKKQLKSSEIKQIQNISPVLLMAYLNGFENAIDYLYKAKSVLKSYPNPNVYLSYKNVLRILRKLKYEM